MHLYDTASRAVISFQPTGPRVGMYVCGITPYDAAHLGHAFTFHTFDVVTRRLRSLGHDVNAVRNITDVDDDMLRVARERGVDYRALGDEQVERFNEDMAALGLISVAAPRASAHVAEMVDMVVRIQARGLAYAVDGWVFFDTRRFPAFGRLCRLGPQEMRLLSAQRGADPDDPRKRDPLDFVLWQRSLPGEPSWPSPWGDGRPGWHIECSVLSTGELGAPIDLHGGGDDLIYPHHEAEIAQAEAAGVRPFVRHWLHVSHVMYEGEKMSKSLGNLVFTRDLLKEVPAATVRILLSAHHYRSSWSFDREELRLAEARRVSYEVALARGGTSRGDGRRIAFLERLDDDLDTPGALRVLDEMAAAVTGGASTPSQVPGSETGGDSLGEMLDLIGAASPSSVTDAA
ncbi:MAG: cysteine--tRNA ligase [Candidatus Dormibacteria bacterium]